MTEPKLKLLIDEAIRLDQDISTKSKRLDEIKDLLVAEAQGREDEHVDTDGGGKSWSQLSASGCLARVTFPSPSLKSKINGETGSGARLLERVGRMKDQIFTPVLAYVPVQNFRQRVQELFSPGEARKIIAACETKSAPRVSFETKEALEKQEAA